VLCSKSREVDRSLKELFRDRLISKRYLAVVSGRVEPAEGELTYPLEDKPSLSRYRVLHHTRSALYGHNGDGNGWISTLELVPVTGRTHQLRRHLKLFGHPIVGDERFTTMPLPLPLADCPYACGGLNCLYLWAVEMEFRHPFNEGNNCESVLQRAMSEITLCESSQKLSCSQRENNDTDIADDNNKMSPLVSSCESVEKQSNVVHVRLAEPQLFQELRDWERSRWEEKQARKNECAETSPANIKTEIKS
jgi:23S rRNA-/tRNA-specific pseudouridylate synthase